MDRNEAVSITRIPTDFDRWDDVLALIMRAFASMDGVVDPPSSAHHLTADTLSDKARLETGFVAVQGDRIVGCVFALERAADLYVGKFAVAPDRQGQGIGRRLMQAVEDLARSRGKAAVALQTRIELTGNHEAFARLGFRETERTAHEGYARPTSITMRKAIS
ncbi:GNAT family N-acetyltransferase [Mesorhizobium sp. M7A.T.Ca.TU.009.01.3.2]|uniref:GNAT family N-acetyltransferase n=10 Tax=Phyllobacteriaceae TaxID=69277 RepID=UPI000FC9A15B|nr:MULTISPECIES: GNAT family N-acetyltransferase [Mesorhizobium]RUU07458.1 GNAT family N-acetyltransferase [Mesorhizobium sp. M7A.T.Ca.TU.009.01.3.2]RUV09921.1 GNAT family N-acetyltransferase [Mesorhizobium sp. M7A.T.Ca.TU.009.01.3.1]RVB37288.1 GNAT family N-acetyltransferase [Mesorhizobium sp. M7A.F.Ca.CA.004.05.1.1]MCF6126513.1 GNAT family N-acetyltransferase [Mesorhizobium ciceri]MCQ8817176.1 GNAT family N-acetyltransferase [Mesorhizobium sp. SEMIA396]